MRFKGDSTSRQIWAVITGLETQKVLKFLPVSVPSLVKILFTLVHSRLIIVAANASVNAADTV